VSAAAPGTAGLVAVVTGGSSGIGRAVVDALAAAGTSVVYWAEDPRLLPASEREGVTGMVADVTDSDAMARLMATAVERYGGLDILVCSAGIQTYGTAEDTTEADWWRVIDVNLTGAFLAAKHAIPWMRRRGAGAIVNVSSVQGQAPKRRVLLLFGEQGRPRRAHPLAGRGPRGRQHPGQQRRPRTGRHPAAPGARPSLPPAGRAGPASGPPGVRRPRVAKPEEVAKLIQFLVGPDASYVTGACYLVDGGIMTGQSPVLLETPVVDQGDAVGV